MYVVVLGAKFSLNNDSAVEQTSDRGTENLSDGGAGTPRYVAKVVKVEAKGTVCEKEERACLRAGNVWKRRRGTLLGKGEPLEERSEKR